MSVYYIDKDRVDRCQCTTLIIQSRQVSVYYIDNDRVDRCQCTTLMCNGKVEGVTVLN